MNQRQIAALLAEAAGTFVLVLVVLNVSRYQLPFFTAIAAGVAIATFTGAFGKLSGANFNPAVTLGLFAIRKVTVFRAIGYLAAQAVAAYGAMRLYEYFVGHSLTNTTTPFHMSVFLAEFVGALVFSLGFVAVVVQKAGGIKASVTIGSALFLGMLVAGLGSNGLLNPALALGVRAFDWNYFLGPVLGFGVGSLLYVYVLDPVTSPINKLASLRTVAAPKAKAPAVKAAPTKKKAAPAKKKTSRK
jgi:glycerol uptake facilitator-like aquaporin